MLNTSWSFYDSCHIATCSLISLHFNFRVCVPNCSRTSNRSCDSEFVEKPVCWKRWLQVRKLRHTVELLMYEWKADSCMGGAGLRPYPNRPHSSQTSPTSSIDVAMSFDLGCPVLLCQFSSPATDLTFRCSFWNYLAVCYQQPPHYNRFTALFSGTTRVSRCQKRTSGLYGARGD